MSSKKSSPTREEVVTISESEYQGWIDKLAHSNRNEELLHNKIKKHEEREAEMQETINELTETVKVLTPFDSAAELSKDDELSRLRNAYKAFEYSVTTTKGLYIKMLVNPMARDVMIIELSNIKGS